MRILISLVLTVLVWPTIDILLHIYDYGSFPSELIWMEVIAYSPFLSLGVSAVFFGIFYGILSAIAHSKKKKRLAPLMSRSLPWHIENDDDMFALPMKFGGNALKGKNRYKTLRTFIRPGERLYFAVASTEMFIHGINEPAGDSEKGDLFLSDCRVVVVTNLGHVVKTFLLQDILSIDCEVATFTFYTEETKVSIVPVGNGILGTDVHKIFVHAAAEAGIEFVCATTETVDYETSAEPRTQTQTQTKTTVNCPGCSAAIAVIVGQTSQCEYCNRFVSATG